MIQDENIFSVAVDLYENAVKPVREWISPNVYAKLLYFVALSTSETPQRGVDILDNAIPSLVQQNAQQAQHCVECIKALLLLRSGQALEARRLMDTIQQFVDGLQTHELDPLLLALLCKSRAQDYELSRNFTKFYQTSFDIVNYCERSRLPLLDAELSALAYKTAIAALLSPETYNFGRLLMFKPFTEKLQNTNDAWLLQWAQICNEGDVYWFNAFVAANSHIIGAIPDLTGALSDLNTKVRLMALLHLVFYTPAECRVFSFQSLAERCVVPLDEVEALILSALALRLIEGLVDGVENVLRVSWVQPRVLSIAEIRELAKRIGAWKNMVQETTDRVAEWVAAIPQ
jgi:26S proteasome regulatory subunit N9